MTWPTEHIITTNVDQGYDSPTIAREQLKQMVDYTNTMMNEFGAVDLSGATNGQIITKQNGSWRPFTTEVTGRIASLKMANINSSTTYSGTSHTVSVVESGNTGVNIVSLSGISCGINVPAGTYIFHMPIPFVVRAIDYTNIAGHYYYSILRTELFNVTANQVESSALLNKIGENDPSSIFHGSFPMTVLTPSVPTTYQIRVTIYQDDDIVPQEIYGFFSQALIKIVKLY